MSAKRSRPRRSSSRPAKSDQGHRRRSISRGYRRLIIVQSPASYFNPESDLQAKAIRRTSIARWADFAARCSCLKAALSLFRRLSRPCACQCRRGQLRLIEQAAEIGI